MHSAKRSNRPQPAYSASMVRRKSLACTAWQLRPTAATSRWLRVPAALFDLSGPAQLFCRPIPDRSSYNTVKSIAISADARTIGLLLDNNGIGGRREYHLAILHGKDWKQQELIPLNVKKRTTVLCVGIGGRIISLGSPLVLTITKSRLLTRKAATSARLRATQAGPEHWLLILMERSSHRRTMIRASSSGRPPIGGCCAGLKRLRVTFASTLREFLLPGCLMI